ncbi:MAG: hypothetical protein COA79_06770 [Planctomycetota bacterium]|nr:MAG: hypothetical protein COA79_06770 [Planctomycetota bacterium]
MKTTVFIFMILIITKTTMFGNEVNFSLGYWKIDVDAYMKEYDKKMTASKNNKKKLKMLKMFRGMALHSVNNTIYEIREDRYITYQKNKDKVVLGKIIKVSAKMIEFKPGEDKKKKGNVKFVKQSDDSIEFKWGKVKFNLIRMNSKDAKDKIVEIKSKEKAETKKK